MTHPYTEHDPTGPRSGVACADCTTERTTTCDDCGAEVKEIIGCPDGAEICQACFDAGNH